MSTTIEGTTVRFARAEDDWRKYSLEVLVKSQKRPGLHAKQTLDPGKAVNAQHLIKGIGAAAALCAEYLCKEYGDLIDPSVCIRDAIRAFGEECRFMAELAKDIDKKLMRLHESSGLSDKERELLSRMRFLVGRGEKLNREEGEWVNQKIAELHGKQL